ncbi:MAG: hypothetical protein WC521_00440 [Bdellovibrionales bacterium]
MKECKSGQCEIDVSDDTGCTCGCTCGCENCTCGCCGKVDEFIGLAKSAHHELLKQKMKNVFEAKIGKKMDKVAEVVVAAALLQMKDRMSEKQAHEQFEKKLMDIFRE